MFSVGMRTVTENLVKWYFFKLAPEFCMKIHFKSDQFNFQFIEYSSDPSKTKILSSLQEKIQMFQFWSSSWRWRFTS